jgi:hypothetical protein
MSEENNQPDGDAGDSTSKPVASLADLLRAPLSEPVGDVGSDEDAGIDPQTEDDKSKPKGKPKTLDDVAARLGIDVADLYKLEFGARGDGERHTLGTLKDMLAESETHATERMAWHEDRTRQQSDLMQERRELEELMIALPEDLKTQKVRDAMKARYHQRVQSERVRMLDVIPAWKNAEVLSAELSAIEQHLSGYGLDASFIIQAASSHRAMRYLRENWLREQRVQKALAQVKEVPKKPTPNGSRSVTPKGGAPQRKSRAPDGTGRLGEMFLTSE